MDIFTNWSQGINKVVHCRHWIVLWELSWNEEINGIFLIFLQHFLTTFYLFPFSCSLSDPSLICPSNTSAPSSLTFCSEGISCNHRNSGHTPWSLSIWTTAMHHDVWFNIFSHCISYHWDITEELTEHLIRRKDTFCVIDIDSVYCLE